MLIIPAIDIKDGKCVRLTRGEYTEQKVYFNNPLVPALKWKSDGASLLHIVDLDGAKEGKMKNFGIIKKIKEKTGIAIEVGGGIRDIKTINDLIDIGIERVIIGTVAIENKDFLRNIVEVSKYIVVSIDIKNEKLRTQGWIKETDIKWNEFLNKLQDYGFYKIIVTDISRDGTLTGININLYKKIAEEFPEMEIIVSGGISSFKDIKMITSLNLPAIKGVIIGKALYEGKINLKEIIEYAGKKDNSLS